MEVLVTTIFQNSQWPLLNLCDQGFQNRKANKQKAIYWLCEVYVHVFGVYLEVHVKLGARKQKVQLKISFNWINGKFQLLNFFTLYKIMFSVIETIFEIKSHILSLITLSAKLIA